MTTTTTVTPDQDNHDDRDWAAAMRVPPNDIAAERAVLGGMILDRRAIDECADIVTHRDFYRPNHADIFDAITTLHWDRQPVDQITLCDHLGRKGILDRVGGTAYIYQLVAETAVAANASYYAKIIADRAVLRRLVEAGTRIVQLGYADGEGDVDDVVGAAQAEVDGVARGAVVDVVSSSEFLDELIESTYADRVSFSAPWPEMTRILTGGFEAERVYTIAARPALGKSASLLNILNWFRRKHRTAVSLTSLEMSRNEVMLRLIADMSGVSLTKLKNPKDMTDFERRQRDEAVNDYRKLPPLFIDDRPDQTVEMMRSFARTCANRAELGAHGVDYLQLFATTPGRKFGTRQEEVSHQSRQVKMTAKALNIPVFMLAQLKRIADKPKLSDLRESGAIEQDSDAVILLHREDDPDTGEQASEVGFFIAKNRSGPIGGLLLDFDGSRMRFTQQPDPVDY